MKISTSINISLSRKKRLKEAAIVLGTSTTDVLAALMARSRIHYDQFYATLKKAVKYQPYAIIENEDYVIMHVLLDPVCYEFGVSERVLFKVSVSLIYRIAIDLFLDILVEKGLHQPINENDIATNYLFLDYYIVYSEDNNKEYWKISWEKRTKKRKRVQNE